MGPGGEKDVVLIFEEPSVPDRDAQGSALTHPTLRPEGAHNTSGLATLRMASGHERTQSTAGEGRELSDVSKPDLTKSLPDADYAEKPFGGTKIFARPRVSARKRSGDSRKKVL